MWTYQVSNSLQNDAVGVVEGTFVIPHTFSQTYALSENGASVRQQRWLVAFEGQVMSVERAELDATEMNGSIAARIRTSVCECIGVESCSLKGGVKARRGWKE